jgi:hypothetical protein
VPFFLKIPGKMVKVIDKKGKIEYRETKDYREKYRKKIILYWEL